MEVNIELGGYVPFVNTNGRLRFKTEQTEKANVLTVRSSDSEATQIQDGSAMERSAVGNGIASKRKHQIKEETDDTQSPDLL
jgi:hypothetical protein